LSSQRNKSVFNLGFKELAGQGDQMYTCKTDPGAPVFSFFKEIQAKLVVGIRSLHIMKLFSLSISLALKAKGW